MKNNNYSGKFFVFEGLDGSGQSTQAELLKDFLIKKGYNVILTKEPTQNSLIGKKIRLILKKKRSINPKRLQELFTNDREDHLKKIIIPALKKGKIVISDRYFFSTFAYGAASGCDLNWLIKINKKFLLPDLTLILKVSPRICIQRIEKRNQGKEKEFFEEEKKLRKVWQYYKIFPQKFKNVQIINGEKTKKEVFNQIKKIIKKFLL